MTLVLRRGVRGDWEAEQGGRRPPAGMGYRGARKVLTTTMLGISNVVEVKGTDKGATDNVMETFIHARVALIRTDILMRSATMTSSSLLMRIL